MEVWLLKSAMATWIDGICMGKIRERERESATPKRFGQKNRRKEGFGLSKNIRSDSFISNAFLFRKNIKLKF